MKTLVIDRTEWARGEENGLGNRLLGLNQKKCCLGFMCLADGIPTDKIYNVGYPEKVANSYPEYMVSNSFMEQLVNEITVSAKSYYPTNSLYENSDFASEAASINDNPFKTEQERESQLIDLFLKNGIELTFIN